MIGELVAPSRRDVAPGERIPPSQLDEEEEEAEDDVPHRTDHDQRQREVGDQREHSGQDDKRACST